MTDAKKEDSVTGGKNIPTEMAHNPFPAERDLNPLRSDAVVMGGGPGGLAAAIHLRRAGMTVVCIEPDPFPHDSVGESLDWSSPGLLAELGICRESLIQDQVATYKKHIEIVTLHRPAYQAQPYPWFVNPPLGFEIVTLHVDRVAMNQRLFEAANKVGVEFLWDRVTELEVEGERVMAVRTSEERRLEARWFIDASGLGGRLLGRKFQIPKMDYGRRKVCLWCHFDTPVRTEGTTFYADTVADEYLTWTWEIPISPKAASVGCVMSAEFVTHRRRQGMDIRQILWEQLEKYCRFDQLLEQQPCARVHSVSYQSYVFTNACGPNWLILGEAASLVDPLTANGVTAALRHAREGTSLILESRHRGELTAHHRWLYNTNLKRMGRAFNHSVETAIYEKSIRWGLGVMPAQRVYTAFSYTINALYSKLRPKGWISMLCFGLLLKGVWAWIEGWAFLGRVNCFLRPGLRARRLQIAAGQRPPPLEKRESP